LGGVIFVNYILKKQTNNQIPSKIIQKEEKSIRTLEDKIHYTHSDLQDIDKEF